MSFNSFEFIWLFPIIFCVYYAVTCRKSIMEKCPKLGNYLLLIISYGLYIKVKPVYALILLWVTAVTYFSAIVIEKKEAYGRKKYLVASGIVLAVLPLLVFKYYNFVSSQLKVGLSYLGVSIGIEGLNWALPLGLSFFTLQSVGYLADVYLKRFKAEHNWWDYMLFVSFFPQTACGPISKAKDLLPQIKSHRQFQYSQFVSGCKWLLWGMFLKVCIADRIGTIVDPVFSSEMYRNGATLFLASILYSFQIYSDFAGYSFMAMGVGKIMGFNLINNFRRPYLSLSVTDFWHRWHISLSTWLKDYIYIPLGGSRCSKSRNYFNIFVTFMVSGIWHGANWTFIFWGILHGVAQIIEKMLGLNKLQSQGFVKAIRILVTFIIVDLAWVFFRMPSLDKAWSVLIKIFTNMSFDMSLVLSNKTLLLPLYLLILKDVVDEYLPNLNIYNSRYLIVRWGGVCADDVVYFAFWRLRRWTVYLCQFLSYEESYSKNALVLCRHCHCRPLLWKNIRYNAG